MLPKHMMVSPITDADASAKFGDVIRRVGPADAAIDRAAATVVTATKAQRAVQRAANQRRNAMIAAADQRLKDATVAFDKAKAAATRAYDAEIAKADEALRVARLRHSDVCAAAQPLLDALPIRRAIEEVRTRLDRLIV